MFRLIILLLLVIPTTFFAQNNDNFSTQGEIYGTVIDSMTSTLMEYVTVAIYKEEDSLLLTGSISDLKGRFSISNVKLGKYYALISFVGYQTRIYRNIEVSKERKVVNLGEIKLDNSVKLKEIVIRGDIPKVSFEIDKKVINVENMTTTIGQSAAEVLQNTPSIQVDAEGNVTLRGSSSYQLLINGISTAMDASDALQSIPASTIKDIEIVTNPSAREQAEGVGGIINIITKKNKLEGISMLVNLSGGNFERYGGDMALNYGEEKNAVNINLAYNQRNSPSEISEERISNFDTYQTKVLNEGESSWKMGGMRLGGEWIFTPNSSHVFSLGSTFGNRLMTPYNNSFYEEFINDSLIRSYENKYLGNITIKSLSNFLAYRYKINKESAEYINFKAIYNYRSVDEINSNDFFNDNGIKTGGNYATESGPSNVWRFDIDYLKTLKNKMVFEAGVQAQFGLAKDDRENFEFDPLLQENVLQPLFSTDVLYNRNVHAAYGLLKGKKDKLGYQFGLRTEYTFRNIEATTIENASQEVKRIDFFPSAHFSYKLSDSQELLFSYSRRINRPRSYYFEPFITWVSPYSIRTGNANLKPEYISSMEVSWIKQIKDKGSFSVEAYTKILTNLINRIPAIYDTNIVIEAPANAGNSFSLGIDPTLIYYFTDWWNTNFGASLYYYSVTSSANKLETKNESFNWNLNWINTFSFKNDLKIQLIAQYRSKSATPLGYLEENYGLDASVRKSFWNSKIAVILQASDILSTRRDITFNSTENLDVYSVRNPFSPLYMVTVSLKLNNYKKMLSKSEQLDDF
jgi:outer membrane receptor protein involved in Fe transport